MLYEVITRRAQQDDEHLDAPALRHGDDAAPRRVGGPRLHAADAARPPDQRVPRPRLEPPTAAGRQRDAVEGDLV